jgi:hypothetical protein
VGDIKLTSVASKQGGTTFRMTPGTSVTGTITITTFFSKPADAPATTAAGAKTSAAAAPAAPVKK